MSEENTNAAEKPKGKGKGILKFLGMLVGAALFAGIGFAVAFFLFAKPFSPNEDILALVEKPEEAEDTGPEVELDENGMPKKKIKPVPEAELFVTSYYTFPDAITTNLAGSRRYLQLSLGVSTQYDEMVLRNVEMHELALRSDVLGVLSSFSEEQAGSKEGRDQLAIDIRAALNKRLEQLEGFGGIEGVFFPSFVLQ